MSRVGVGPGVDVDSRPAEGNPCGVVSEQSTPNRGTRGWDRPRTRVTLTQCRGVGSVMVLFTRTGDGEGSGRVKGNSPLRST